MSETPATEAAFAFTPANKAKADAAIARYPAGRQQSAVLPLLDLAQRQNGGWLTTEMIEYVADYLAMPLIRVHEVATFYSMLNLKPIGKTFVQVCRTTPCWLCGSDDLVAAYRELTGCGIGETTPDGQFTLIEVECLGACCNAPMAQINDDYYEDLTPETFQRILTAFKNGERPPAGSQAGRRASEPAGGLTSLTQRAPEEA